MNTEQLEYPFGIRDAAENSEYFYNEGFGGPREHIFGLCEATDIAAAKKRDSMRRWREKNGKKIDVTDPKYIDKLQRAKEYRANNRARCTAYNKRWREANPDYVKKYREKKNRQRRKNNE